MHPNYCQITILLVVDLLSSLAYFMMTHPLPIASKLPIKTLVAKQLPTNTHAHTHTHTYLACLSRRVSYNASLVPMPSHVFQCTREKSGRSGRSGMYSDVVTHALSVVMDLPCDYKLGRVGGDMQPHTTTSDYITRSTRPSQRTGKNMARPWYEAS